MHFPSMTLSNGFTKNKPVQVIRQPNNSEMYSWHNTIMMPAAQIIKIYNIFKWLCWLRQNDDALYYTKYEKNEIVLLKLIP